MGLLNWLRDHKAYLQRWLGWAGTLICIIGMMSGCDNHTQHEGGGEKKLSLKIWGSDCGSGRWMVECHVICTERGYKGGDVDRIDCGRGVVDCVCTN